MPDLFDVDDPAHRAERARVDAADKRFAELAERFAHAGFVLSVVDAPSPIVVSRWALSRGFASLAEAEVFLATVTGRRQ